MGDIISLRFYCTMKRNINQAQVPFLLPESRGATAMRVLLILSIAGQVIAPILNPDNSNGHGFHDQAALLPGGGNFGMLPSILSGNQALSYEQYTGSPIDQSLNPQNPNSNSREDRAWEDGSRMVKLSGFGGGLMLQGANLMLPGLNVALPRRALSSINEQMLDGAQTISFADRTGTRYLAEASQLATETIAKVGDKTADAGANMVVGLLRGYEQHFDGLFRPTKTEVLRNMADALMGSDYALPEGGASSMMLEYIRLKKPASVSELRAVFLDTVLAASQVVRNNDGTFTQFLDNGQSVTLDENAAMDIFSESILYFGSEMASRKAVATWNSMLDAVGLSDLKQQASDDYDVPETKPSGLSNNSYNLPEAVVRGPDLQPIAGMTVASQEKALMEALNNGTLTQNYEYVLVDLSADQSRALNMPNGLTSNQVLYIRDKATGNLIPQGAFADPIFEGLATPLDIGNGQFDLGRMPTIKFTDPQLYKGLFADPNLGVSITGSDIRLGQISMMDYAGNPLTIKSADFGSYNFRLIELRKVQPGNRNFVIQVADGSGNPIGIMNADTSFINTAGFDHNAARHSVGFTFSSLPESQQVFSVIDNGKLTTATNYSKLLSGQSVVIDGVEFTPVFSGGSPVASGLGEGTNMIVSVTNSAGETLPPVYIQQKSPGMKAQAFWMSPEESAMLARMPQEYWGQDFIKVMDRLNNGGHVELNVNGTQVKITSMADLDAYISNPANSIKLPGRTNPRLSSFSSFLNSKGVLYSFNFASYGLQFLDIAKPWIKAEINRPYLGNSCGGDSCDGASFEFWYPISQMTIQGMGSMYNMYPASITQAEVDVSRLEGNPNDKNLYFVYLGDRVAFNDGARPSLFGAMPVIFRSDEIASRFFMELIKPSDPSRSKINPVFLTPGTWVRVFNQDLGEVPDEHIVAEGEDYVYEQFKVNVVDSLPTKVHDIDPYDYPNRIHAQVVSSYLESGTPVLQDVIIVALRDKSGRERIYIKLEDGMSNLRADSPNFNSLVAEINYGK
jgi:hypothetical protein